MRLLGLDVGSKTVGVAISDPLGITAQELKQLRLTKASLALVCVKLEKLYVNMRWKALF